jgi:hypothetical protein
MAAGPFDKPNFHAGDAADLGAGANSRMGVSPQDDQAEHSPIPGILDYSSAATGNLHYKASALACFACGVLGIPFAIVFHLTVVRPAVMYWLDLPVKILLPIFGLEVVGILASAMTFGLIALHRINAKERGSRYRWLIYCGFVSPILWIVGLLIM